MDDKDEFDHFENDSDRAWYVIDCQYIDWLSINGWNSCVIFIRWIYHSTISM
jgi:hypothetical protein